MKLVAPLLLVLSLVLGSSLAEWQARPSRVRHQHLSHVHRRRQVGQDESLALALQRAFNEGEFADKRVQRAPRSTRAGESSKANENIGEFETFYIRKDSNGSLPCLPVVSGDSRSIMGKIEWFKEDKKLVEAVEKRVVEWNTKSTIAYLPDSGALLFRGVTNEDSGEYHCQLTKQQALDSEEGTVRFYVQGKLQPDSFSILLLFAPAGASGQSNTCVSPQAALKLANNGRPGENQ